MRYSVKDLYEGMKVRCVSTTATYWWNIGKEYTLSKGEDDSIILKDETGYIWKPCLILDFLHGKGHCKLEIVEEEQETKYTEDDLYEGMKLRCVDNSGVKWWTTGKEYKVIKSVTKLDIHVMGAYYIKDDDGDKHETKVSILRGINDKDAVVRFEVIEEEKEMEYTEKDIREGTKLRCTKANPSWWQLGKVYTVSLNDDGILQITDDNGHGKYTDYMLDCLNGNHNPVSFEIVEEEKEMTKYVEVTKLIDWSRDQELLEVGKVYKVEAEYKESIYVKGVSIYINENEPSYYLRDGQFKYVEQNKEEKEMKKYKYAKITKYAGFNGMDERNGLGIGKAYKIVSYEDAFTDDCRIYLNEEHPNYFISETQYELVEKEHPSADTKVDLKSAIQAKIDALTTEAERLFTKRDRLEEHAINLNAKARRLEEVVETIKEFE